MFRNVWSSMCAAMGQRKPQSKTVLEMSRLFSDAGRSKSLEAMALAAINANHAAFVKATDPQSSENQRFQLRLGKNGAK